MKFLFKVPARSANRAVDKYSLHRTDYSKCNLGRQLRNNLPSPIVYYARELREFYPRKTQATAICPFHNDRKPSLSVNLSNGKFFCFSCGASGGSIISFHMKRYQEGKQQAIKSIIGGVL